MDSPCGNIQSCDTKLQEELERKTQELHVAGMTLERLKANIDHLEGENRELKSLLAEESVQSCRKESDPAISSNRHQITDLLQELDDARASEKNAQEEASSLQKKVKELTELLTATTAQAGSQSFSMELEQELAELTEKLNQLEALKSHLENKLVEATEEIHMGMDRLSQMQRDMEEKDEEIECLESQFSSQCSINERLREEVQDLRTQLETETVSTNPDRKGNSLFSEVDDRRVRAEKKLVHVQAQLTDLEERLTQEQKENKRLKHQIAVLRQTFTKGYSASEVKDLQTELQESKKKILQLTEQLQQQQQRQPPANRRVSMIEQKQPNLDNSTGTDKQFISFLQVVIKQKEKECEDAKKETQQKHVQVLRLELDLTQAKHEVTNLTHKLDQLKVSNVQLAMELQEMQKKFEPEKYCPNGKEKLPVFSGDLINPQDPRSPLKTRDDLENQDPSSSSLHKSKSKTSDDPFEAVQRMLGKTEASRAAKKSVHMADEVKVISTEGVKDTAQLAEDGKGTKLKRHPNPSSTGKYKSITYSTAKYDEDKPADCKQQ